MEAALVYTYGTPKPGSFKQYLELTNVGRRSGFPFLGPFSLSAPPPHSAQNLKSASPAVDALFRCDGLSRAVGRRASMRQRPRRKMPSIPNVSH